MLKVEDLLQFLQFLDTPIDNSVYVELVHIYGTANECKTIVNNYKQMYKIESGLVIGDKYDRYNYIFFLFETNRTNSPRSKLALKNLLNFHSKTDLFKKVHYKLDQESYNTVRTMIHDYYPDLDDWEFDISNQVVFNPWFRNNGTWKYKWETKHVKDIFRYFRNPKCNIVIIRSKYVGRDCYDLHYATRKSKEYIQHKK